MDSEQHEVWHLRHPAEGIEDGRVLRRQHDGDSGDVQARCRAVHRLVGQLRASHLDLCVIRINCLRVITLRVSVFSHKYIYA